MVMLGYLFPVRRRSAEARYDTAMQLYRDVGWMEEGLLFDEENRVFRFVSDGTFAFSREYALLGGARAAGVRGAGRGYAGSKIMTSENVSSRTFRWT